MNPSLIESNRTTMAAHNIGDKVMITHRRGCRSGKVSFAILEKFGYNSMDEIILGFKLVANYSDREDVMVWLHPDTGISTFEKI